VNIEHEFATIDTLLASEAETRGVDAFILALIKAERQMRKLFTYLVFQSPAFGPDHIRALRDALAGRRVYFRDFIAAWDKLYARPLREIVGPDYDRLRAALDEAITYRNKIFHGQLTSKYLSREDLIAYVALITRWCRALAAGSQLEIGYDGFARNSFRKSNSAMGDRFVATMTSIRDYEIFLAEMEKRPSEALQSMSGGQNNTRLLVLIEKFPTWISYFETNGPFRKYGQLEHHRETIGRRLELGSAAAAVTDERFQRALYKTLRAWGIGSRRSRLKPFDEFAAILSGQRQAVAQFEQMILDDRDLDVPATTDALWALVSQLPIVENTATLVPVTKTLHHVLPDLVVPIDREYTQSFFGWQNPQFQYGQRDCFTEAFHAFVQIARAVNPSQYVHGGWNSSRTKVVDNALVGLLRWAKDHGTLDAGG
jgi:hypothetical protein